METPVDPRAIHLRPPSKKVGELLEGFRAGRRAALARMVSVVEDERAGFQFLLHALHASGLPRGARIGITGPPGVGKSSLVAEVVKRLREKGREVGVLAVDPTSPYSGGALLGDRIRMGDLATDPGVFIRSMASRGSLGGLATTTKEVLDVMDAFGLPELLVETVGVGQAEVEVTEAVDTVVVVLMPDQGDAVQAMKAGLMEIADIFVVNKADRPGAERLVREIRGALDLASAEPWTPPVLLTTASRGEGVGELLEEIERHRRHLQESGELARRRTARTLTRVRDVMERELRRRVRRRLAAEDVREEVAVRIAGGDATPYSEARRLLDEGAAGESGTLEGGGG